MILQGRIPNLRAIKRNRGHEWDYGVDATLKALLELVTAIGIVAVFAILLIYVFILEQRNRAAAQTRQDAFMKQMADIVAAQVKNAEQQQEHLELMRLELEAMRQTLAQTSEAKQEVIRQNSQALIELKAEYLKSVEQMQGAQERIVTDVNKHTDESQTITGEAITAAQNENREAHAGQTEDLQTKMDNLQKALEQNGKDTRAKVDDVLKKLESMTLAIEDMQKDLKAMGIDKGLMALKLDQLVQTVDNIKRDLTPPPTLPPPDPLAPVPPKASEVK